MIKGKWENSYIQELGILDHCVEIIELKNEVRTWKALREMGRSKLLLASLCIALEKEMMDLLLILEKWAENKSDLKKERELRFEEKEQEETE